MGKTLKDLTIKDNFMFAAVMMEDENCKEFLEMLLGIKIAKICRITISRQRNRFSGPICKETAECSSKD